MFKKLLCSFLVFLLLFWTLAPSIALAASPWSVTPNTTLSASEKFTNTGFESNVNSWDTYALEDRFTTALAAGSVNATSAEPTGGTRTVVDTNSKLSITGGLLDFATGNATNDGIWYPSFSRVLGRTLIGTITMANTAQQARIGWGTAQSGAINDSIRLVGDGTSQIITNGTLITGIGLYTATTYQLAVVMRATGIFYFIKGGAFTNWTLIWVSTAGTAAGYPAVNSANGIFTADDIRIPNSLFIPTPTAYDTFTTASSTSTETTSPDNQPISSLPWTGSTWSVSGGSVSNTPTQGSELLTDGGLENWTSPTNLTSWVESLEGGTSTVNQETSVINGGSNAARYDIDSGNNSAMVTQQVTHSVGDWLLTSSWLRASVSGKSLANYNSSSSYGASRNPGTTYTQYFDVFRPTTANTSFGT